MFFSVSIGWCSGGGTLKMPPQWEDNVADNLLLCSASLSNPGLGKKVTHRFSTLK